MPYSKKVIEHFKNPHNQGVIKNADAIGKVGNPVCGDVMKIYLKIKDDKIANIKFETLGCAAAIAVSSALTQMAKGKTLGQALKVLDKKGKLHGSLYKGFSALYGYTSDADGIRHAMMDESNLVYSDAKYMFVSCTTFINYLIDKTK